MCLLWFSPISFNSFTAPIARGLRSRTLLGTASDATDENVGTNPVASNSVFTERLPLRYSL